MQPIKLDLTLDLDHSLRSFHGFDRDGEAVAGPTTVEELVVIAAADRLIERQMARGSRPLANMIDEVRTEEIRARVVPMVEAALAGPVQRTDTWGAPNGAPTTIPELVAGQVSEYLTRPLPGRRSDDRRTSLQTFIADEVEKAVTGELRAALDEAKATVRQAVVAQAAEVIQETIARAVGVKA